MVEFLFQLACFAFVAGCAWSLTAGDLPPIELIAHRGASHDAPENTLAALRLGFEQACDAGELDVWISRDGPPHSSRRTRPG